MIGLRRRITSLWVMHPGWWALLATIALTLIGIEAIRTVDPHFAQKQTIWFVIALITMPLCLLPRPRVIGLASYALLMATLALLVFVIIPGLPRAIVPHVHHTTAWINLKFMRLQPSELTKITFVLAMAWYLRHGQSYRSLRGLMAIFAFLFIPVALIFKQPDLGTALLFGPTLLVILVAAGAKLRHITALLAAGTLAVALIVASIFYAPPVADLLLKPHQQNRFKAMASLVNQDPRYDNTFNYQPRKSRMLIGAGQLFGYGKQGSSLLVQKVHKLPEAHNDMIFAVIVNRWGLAGALVIFGLYMIIITSLSIIAGKSHDPFVRLATVGFAGLIFTQAAINIAVNIGLLPVTGITLPFVSYGGSSLVTTYAMIGLAMNFATLQPAIISRPSFEFDEYEAVHA